MTLSTADWLLVKVFMSHSTQNRSFRRRPFPQANLFAWHGKNKTQHNKSTQTPIKRNVQQHEINTKKLKPGLIASCDIRPRNGEGLLQFRRFINLSLTYLLRHLPLTAPDLHGAANRGRHGTDCYQNEHHKTTVNSDLILATSTFHQSQISMALQTIRGHKTNLYLLFLFQFIYAEMA